MIHIQKPDGTVLTWMQKHEIFLRWNMRKLMIERDAEELKVLVENNTLSRHAPEGVCKMLSEQFGERKPDTGISIRDYDRTIKAGIDKRFLTHILSDFAQFYHSGMNSGSWSGRPVINSVEIAEEWTNQNLSGILNFK